MNGANFVHVVADANDAGAFRCLYCNARHAVRLPVPIAEYVAAGEAFTELHQRCVQPQEGASDA